MKWLAVFAIVAACAAHRPTHVARREQAWPGWCPNGGVSVGSSSACMSAAPATSYVGDTTCWRLPNAPYMPIYCPSSELR